MMPELNVGDKISFHACYDNGNSPESGHVCEITEIFLRNPIQYRIKIRLPDNSIITSVLNARRFGVSWSVSERGDGIPDLP